MTDRNPPALIGQLFEMDGRLCKVDRVSEHGSIDAVGTARGTQFSIGEDFWRTSDSINFPSQSDFNVEHKDFGEHTTSKNPGEVVLYFGNGPGKWCMAAIAIANGKTGNPAENSPVAKRSAVVPSDRVGEVADWVRSVGGIVYKSTNAPKPPLDFPAPGPEVDYGLGSTMDLHMRKHVPAGVYVLFRGRLEITRDCNCANSHGCQPHVGPSHKLNLSSDALTSWLTLKELECAKGADSIGIDGAHICNFRGKTADGTYQTTGFWSRENQEVDLPDGLIEHFIYLMKNRWRDIEKKEELRQRDEMSHPLAQPSANGDVFPTETITTKTGQTLAKIVHGNVHGVSMGCHVSGRAVANTRAVDRLEIMDPKITAHHVCPRCNASIDMPAHHGNAKCKCGWPHGAQEAQSAPSGFEKYVVKATMDAARKKPLKKSPYWAVSALGDMKEALSSLDDPLADAAKHDKDLESYLKMTEKWLNRGIDHIRKRMER